MSEPETTHDEDDDAADGEGGREAPEPFRLTLFVPGTPSSHQTWAEALAAQGLALDEDRLAGPVSGRAEWIANDGTFGDAFSFGTASAADRDAIDAAGSALVLHLPVALDVGRAALVALARQLHAAGALAIRLESSRLGYPIRRWIALVDGDDPWTLYNAAVVSLRDGDRVTTCGMHAFCRPDATVRIDEGLDAAAAQDLVATLNVYQLAEDPLLLSGQTFSPDAESPRRTLDRWPDDSYPPDHACHNPYGTWRVGPAGGKARGVSKLAYVFIPALVVLLRAMEDQAERPLEASEVDTLVKGAACMTMEHDDARELERTRGYADLDPERAFEQWQVLRGIKGGS